MTLETQDLDMRRVTRTLAEVANSLAAADRVEERIVAALTLIRQVIPFQVAALLETVPREGRCMLYTVPSLASQPAVALRTRLESIAALLADDGQEGAETPSVPGAGGEAGAHLAIPVLGLNQVIGVLFVEQSGPSYDEHGLRLLSVLAAQFGSYLTTLRLRDEELQHARQLGVALQRLQETDRKKDEFLAMLGHELRNPLGAINTALRVIDQRGADDAKRYHQVIDRQIHHLSRIVDDLLDASRVRLGKIVIQREPVDLNHVAQRWMETFGPTNLVQAHDVEMSLAPAPVIVNGDPVRLEQVFSNVLTNALKYTPPGGRIRVSVTAERGEGVIRIVDNGIGMAPDVLATVFDLFTQADESLSRSQGGLGLGLPLVRSLVEKHGGTVEASSDGLGKGSEFVIRLPLSSGLTVDAPAGASKPSYGQPASLRILIVEDNDDARDTLKEMLTLWEHSVECAGDGLQAVAYAVARPYDVLLVDIGLPKLDGYEVARQVREQLGERTPALLAMTGYGQPEDRRRAADAGFDAHLVKPLNLFDLQERLGRVKRQR